MGKGQENELLLPAKVNGRSKNCLTLAKGQETPPSPTTSLASKNKLQDSPGTKGQNPLSPVPGQGTLFLMEVQKQICLPSEKGQLLLLEGQENLSKPRISQIQDRV